MFKEQLMSSLKKAVDLHNTGLDDSEAVVKAANDAGFNEEQAKRLTEVYNTTKTICFFKTSEDRTVSFTTAKSERVLERLFGKKDNDAPKQKNASGFIPDYSCYDERIKSAEAEGEIVPLRKKDYFDRDMDGILREGYRVIRSEKQSADYCDGVASQLLTKYCMVLDHVAADIKRAYHFKGDAANEAINYIYATTPERAEALAGDLLARLPGVEFKKSAELSEFDMKEPGIAADIDQATSLKTEWAEMRACAQEFGKMAQDDEAELLKASELAPKAEEEDFFVEGLRERVKSAAHSYEGTDWTGMLAGTEEKDRKHPKKETMVDPLSDVFKMVGEGVGSAAKKEIETGASKVVSGPYIRGEKKTTDRLRNFQRQVILEDLMYTDPILSGMDPQRVVQAYATVTRLAPEVALNKEVVRAILRASTNAEAVSTYDAKQLAELESEIRKQTALQQGGDKINIKL